MAMLIDYFPDWITGGIFASSAMAWCPWCDELTNEELHGLDIEYFGNRSGYKQCSPLIDKIAYPLPDRQISGNTERMEMLKHTLKALYNYEWTKLWNAWKAQYNPLDNYNLTEHKAGNFEESGSKDTETNAKSETEMSTENSVKPLNSSAFEPLTKSDTDMETTRQKADNKEEVTTGKEGSDEYWKTRAGNIGTMTYQDMLQKEMDLRKNHFFDIIMADLDKVLTIPYRW